MLIALKNVSSCVDMGEIMSEYIKDVVVDAEEGSIEDSDMLNFLSIGLLARDSAAIWPGDESTDPTEFVFIFWSIGILVAGD